MLDRFERGEITPEEWRQFRLLRGTYGQRQDADAQMLRIKIPQGILDAAHLEALADVAERYSRGFGHISTRQNMQFHFVKLHDAEPAMRHLADAGMTTREACGNSVRNITACPYAGVARDEVFDVTPYAEAMTRYLLRHPLELDAAAQVQDCVRRVRRRGSRGHVDQRSRMARRAAAGRVRPPRIPRQRRRRHRDHVPQSGASLYEFLPASDILMVAEAVLRVFQRYGDYEHKQRNRLKFLVKTMGWDAWQAAFQKELDELRAAGGARCHSIRRTRRSRQPPGERAEAPSIAEITALVTATPVRGPGIVPVVEVRDGGPGRERTEWLRTNLRPQKQGEYSQVTVSLVLGDITGGQMRALAVLARAYADGTVRVTVDQNLVHALGQERAGARVCTAGWRPRGWHDPGAGTITDVTSCPGAESCRLAVTQSRGLARLIEDNLDTAAGAGARRVGRAHQDQRLPERLRPASCRGHWIPGQHPEARRSRRCRSTS